MSETPKNKSESWAPPPQKESPNIPPAESTISYFREGIKNRVWRRKRWTNKSSN